MRRDLAKLKSSGIDSIAVVLAHSYAVQEQELNIGKIAKEIGSSKHIFEYYFKVKLIINFKVSVTFLFHMK